MAGPERQVSSMSKQEKRTPQSRKRQQSQGQKAPQQPKTKHRFDPLRLFSSAEIVLVRKDLGALWSRKGMRALLLLLPLALMVAIPVVYFVAISLLPVPRGAQVPEALLGLLSQDAEELGYRQAWAQVFTTLLCPLLFLCVPLVCSAVLSSCAFVMEKEEGTLETLLLSSMSAKSVYNAKVTSCTILSVAVSFLSFLVFAITVTVVDVALQVPFFFNLQWLVLLFLVMPALALFSVVFISLVLPRVHSTLEALQTMGYLILPVAVLCLVQLTGAVRWNAGLLLLMAIALFIADVALFNASGRRFQAQRLLEKTREEP